MLLLLLLLLLLSLLLLLVLRVAAAASEVSEAEAAEEEEEEEEEAAWAAAFSSGIDKRPPILRERSCRRSEPWRTVSQFDAAFPAKDVDIDTMCVTALLLVLLVLPARRFPPALGPSPLLLSETPPLFVGALAVETVPEMVSPLAPPERSARSRSAAVATTSGRMRANQSSVTRRFARKNASALEDGCG